VFHRDTPSARTKHGRSPAPTRACGAWDGRKIPAPHAATAFGTRVTPSGRTGDGAGASPCDGATTASELRRFLRERRIAGGGGGGGGGDEDGKRARSAATTPSPSAPWKMLKANAAADLGAILTETERRDMMSEVEDSHRPFVLSEVEKPPQRENKRVLRIRKPAMIRAPAAALADEAAYHATRRDDEIENDNDNDNENDNENEPPRGFTNFSPVHAGGEKAMEARRWMRAHLPSTFTPLSEQGNGSAGASLASTPSMRSNAGSASRAVAAAVAARIAMLSDDEDDDEEEVVEPRRAESVRDSLEVEPEPAPEPEPEPAPAEAPPPSPPVWKDGEDEDDDDDDEMSLQQMRDKMRDAAAAAAERRKRGEDDGAGAAAGSSGASFGATTTPPAFRDAKSNLFRDSFAELEKLDGGEQSNWWGKKRSAAHAMERAVASAVAAPAIAEELLDSVDAFEAIERNVSEEMSAASGMGPDPDPDPDPDARSAAASCAPFKPTKPPALSVKRPDVPALKPPAAAPFNPPKTYAEREAARRAAAEKKTLPSKALPLAPREEEEFSDEDMEDYEPGGSSSSSSEYEEEEEEEAAAAAFSSSLKPPSSPDPPRFCAELSAADAGYVASAQRRAAARATASSSAVKPKVMSAAEKVKKMAEAPLMLKGSYFATAVENAERSRREAARLAAFEAEEEAERAAARRSRSAHGPRRVPSLAPPPSHGPVYAPPGTRPSPTGLGFGHAAAFARQPNFATHHPYQPSPPPPQHWGMYPAQLQVQQQHHHHHAMMQQQQWQMREMQMRWQQQQQQQRQTFAPPQPSPTPRVQGAKRVTPQGRRRRDAPASATKHVRFAETPEGRAVRELLGDGARGGSGGERYVNRVKSATGAPTSLSTEEAKLLASLRRLDAHCLAHAAGGSALDGLNVRRSATVDAVLDLDATRNSRRSVEEAALLASLTRLDDALDGARLPASRHRAVSAPGGARRVGVVKMATAAVAVAAPASATRRRAPRGGQALVTDAWGGPPPGSGVAATLGVSRRTAPYDASGAKVRPQRRQVGYVHAVSAATAAASKASKAANDARSGGKTSRAREHLRSSGGAIHCNGVVF